MLVDARSVGEGSEIVADLCVVGSGPAGIAIVERLRGSGLQICLVESGGLDPELATQRLYRGSKIGRPYYRLDTCRYRLFGGTSNRWGGWCRPLDAGDFDRRDWIPSSGWPIGSQALEPYFDAAARLFQLKSPAFELATWRRDLPEPFALQGDDFENVVFTFSPKTNFADAYGADILAANDVTTLLHANLIGIELDAGTNRVGRLRVQALGRRPFSIRAKAAVLATGGIENARLLLASRSDRPAGLGNENDLVGRFFMEHLNVPAGHVITGPRGPSRNFYRRGDCGGASLRGFIVPTAAAQRRNHLASASIAIEPRAYSYGTPCIGWPPAVTYGPIGLYRRFRRRHPLAADVARQTLTLAWSLPLRLSTLRASHDGSHAGAPAVRRLHEEGRRVVGSLYVRAEQTPNPASRVLLSDRRDACGVPEVQLDWRIDPFDIRSIETWLAKLDATFAANGVGRVVMPPENWAEGIIGGPHHMGTTRMSADPKTGVVDEHCRVHSVENLYIAGSSVFATGGYANPTFTLVALALRLADHLRARPR